MKSKPKNWIELGYAPIPVDIRKNIKNFSLKYPLEYTEIMDKYNITASNYDMLQFSLYSRKQFIFEFDCNLNKEYCFSISYNKPGRKITLHSNDGYIFKNPDIKYYNHNYKETGLNHTLVLVKEIQDMLGIINLSDVRIEFKQQIEESRK